MRTTAARRRPAGTSAAALATQARRRRVAALLTSGRIAAALQPILRLSDDAVIGYEALARFPPTPELAAADDLFAAATALGMQAAVDMACLGAALRTAPNLGGADLFVNVLIGTLLDRTGMGALDREVSGSGVAPSSVVLEFSEREPVADLTHLKRIATELRGRGYRIAVDDAGAGHASMRVIAELRPEFIKLDREIIRALDMDESRRALVVALLSFAGHIGARVIAEGIETAAEKATLLSLGVRFGQGWALQAPVLIAPLEGHAEMPVVDSGWFARRTVAPAGPRAVPSLGEPAPAAEPPRGARRHGSLARALSDAALALQNEHDPMRILSVMADHMSRVVPVKDMAIFVADHETHRLVPVLATGSDREAILAQSHSLDAGLSGWALAVGTPQNVPNATEHPRARHVPGTPVIAESVLLAPLVAGDRKLGIIVCWRNGIARFSARDLEAASLFAHVAASAWRNAQLYAELLSAAMTDPLTQLYNSRWLRDTAQRDLQRSARDGRPMALLLLDLDHFKRVNDTCGHATGDLLLQRVAMTLRATLRGTDAVVRIGGEEFVVLLHDADADAAEGVAEALRRAVHKVPLPGDLPLARLSVSIGVASHPEHGTDLDELLGAADRAMYTAKGAGRDRVVRAGSPAGGAVLPLPAVRRGGPAHRPARAWASASARPPRG
jgi:diguanylate cyclase (GGDEF)-like protein